MSNFERILRNSSDSSRPGKGWKSGHKTTRSIISIHHSVHQSWQKFFSKNATPLFSQKNSSQIAAIKHSWPLLTSSHRRTSHFASTTFAVASATPSIHGPFGTSRYGVVLSPKNLRRFFVTPPKKSVEIPYDSMLVYSWFTWLFSYYLEDIFAGKGHLSPLSWCFPWSRWSRWPSGFSHTEKLLQQRYQERHQNSTWSRPKISGQSW